MVSDTLINNKAKTAQPHRARTHTSLQALKNRHDAHQRMAWLESLSTFDDLTGLANRRGFVEALTRELDRVARGLAAGGLILQLELDNYKTIRHDFGPDAADTALCLVADTLKSAIRRMDIAARLSGEDFIILLANASPLAAADRAQKLALTLNGLQLRFKADTIPLHASIAMRPYTARDTAENLLTKDTTTEHMLHMQRAEITRAILNGDI